MAVQVPLRGLVLYFLKLGSLGFGGPVALVGYMQRDLVDERGWITQQEYSEGLSLAQLAPGPLAAQLAIYLGWVRGGVTGATLAGLAFVLPSFLIVLGLSALYVRYGGLPWMRSAFYGVGAAVIGIMIRGGQKLVQKNVARDKLLWGICAISALITAITESEMLWVFLAAGILCLIVRARKDGPGRSIRMLAIPSLLLTGIHQPASLSTVNTLFWYFAQAGAFVFGSGLAIVPFLHGGVVAKYGWLTEAQFLDAVAVAMITPGPVVITVAFIGYLVAGIVGAAVAALGVFLPCYLLVVFPAPFYHRFAANPRLKAFVNGVTAAAVGAILGAAFVLGRRAITDVTTGLIAIGALIVLTKIRKLPEPLVILAAGLLGVLLGS